MNSELKEHIIKLLEKNIRLDGRKPLDYRKISIDYGISKNAEGSARVKIGDTIVLAGVKMDIAEPYPDKPDEGTISVNAELSPLSNPEFELGPPGIEAIELARVVDRGIRESNAIDFKKLCIKKGEKVWILNIDIAPINDYGNLFDASSLAAISALKDANFPKLEGDEINYKEKTDKHVPLAKIPIEVSVFKIGKFFIVDPLPQEELVMDARLTVASLEDGQICALQKGGDGALSFDDINKMVDIAIEKAKKLRTYLK